MSLCGEPLGDRSLRIEDLDPLTRRQCEEIRTWSLRHDYDAPLHIDKSRVVRELPNCHPHGDPRRRPFCLRSPTANLVMDRRSARAEIIGRLLLRSPTSSGSGEIGRGVRTLFGYKGAIRITVGHYGSIEAGA